jgi:hypothetical protein
MTVNDILNKLLTPSDRKRASGIMQNSPTDPGMANTWVGKDYSLAQLINDLKELNDE